MIMDSAKIKELLAKQLGILNEVTGVIADAEKEALEKKEEKE